MLSSKRFSGLKPVSPSKTYVFPISLFAFTNTVMHQVGPLGLSNFSTNFASLEVLSYKGALTAQRGVGNQSHRLRREPQQQNGEGLVDGQTWHCPTSLRDGHGPLQCIQSVTEREIAFYFLRMIREKYMYHISLEKEAPLVPFSHVSSQIKSEFH